MGIFDIINFNVVSSADLSWDLRLLDTPCDHKLRDEAVNYDISPVISNTPYSGNDTIFNVATFSGGIDPNASLTITTQYPYANDGSFSIRQGVPNPTGTVITENIIVPPAIQISGTAASGISSNITLMYPPQTNTVDAEQIITSPNGESISIPFTRYNLFQLYGNVQFTDPLDAGSVIQFTYMADNKKITQTNQDGTINWVYNGLNQAGQGVWTIYGRAFPSTQAQLYIRYKTVLQACPKCAGQGMLNDLFLDANGRFQEVYDFSKMLQDFFKRFFTQLGSNTFDLSEGTDIPSLIGTAKGDSVTLDTLIKTEIIDLITTIRNKQATQTNIQTLGLGEQIAQVNSVSVTSPTSTSLQVIISVTSMSGATQQISTTITIGGGN